MNREIKFRGKFNNKWFYGSLLKSTHNDYYIGVLLPKEQSNVNMSQVGRGNNKTFNQHIAIGFVRIKEETVGQYVGLKDKNGVEIYEGDNVTFNNPKGKIENGFVIYRDDVGAFAIEIKIVPLMEMSVYFTDDISNIEVIGNIHDKKEEIRC